MENKNAPFKRNSSLVKQRRMTEGWIPAFAGMTEEESGMADEDFTLTPPSPLKGENSIEYRVYSEKEIRYKERYKIKRQVARCKVQVKKQNTKYKDKVQDKRNTPFGRPVFSLQFTVNKKYKRKEMRDKKSRSFSQIFSFSIIKSICCFI